MSDCGNCYGNQVVDNSVKCTASLTVKKDAKITVNDTTQSLQEYEKEPNCKLNNTNQKLRC